jgi:hypothetical protein
MAKTLLPFSQLIEGERRRWAPFKRALPKADQAIVDRLFDGTKRHVQAGVRGARPSAFETIVMAVLLTHEKQIEKLIRELHKIKMARADHDPLIPPAKNSAP